MDFDNETAFPECFLKCGTFGTYSVSGFLGGDCGWRYFCGITAIIMRSVKLRMMIMIVTVIMITWFLMMSILCRDIPIRKDPQCAPRSCTSVPMFHMSSPVSRWYGYFTMPLPRYCSISLISGLPEKFLFERL